MMRFPLSVAYYIRKHHDELYSPKIQSRLGFLYSGYVKNAEFWEVHEIIRKTVLTGAIIYLQALPSVQVGVATMVCTFTIGTLNYFKPQKSRIVFWLAQLSFLVTTFKFISAMILLGSDNTAERESVGIVLIALDILFFIGSIAATVMTIYLLWDKIKRINEDRSDETAKNKVHPVTKNFSDSIEGRINVSVRRAGEVDKKNVRV